MAGSMRMGVFGVHATEPVQLIAFYKFDPYVVKMANRHEALNVLFKLSFVFDEINPASNSAINLISIAVSSKELTVNTNKIYAERIASEYSPRATSKVVALRKLDAKAKRPAHIFVYTFGIVSALFFLGGGGDVPYDGRARRCRYAVVRLGCCPRYCRDRRRCG